MYKFKEVEFMTIKEKRLVLKNWIAFLKHLAISKDEVEEDKYGNSIPVLFRHFTKRLYEHLHLHCGFIAHYNQFGFFGTYFEEPDDTQLFFERFMANNTIEDYIDLDKAMKDEAEKILNTIKDKAEKEQKQLDIERAKQLLNRHGIELSV